MKAQRSQHPAATRHHALIRIRVRDCLIPLMALVLWVNSPAGAVEAEPIRALRDLNTSSFSFTPVQNKAEWQLRHEEIQRRVCVAAGLYPMPEKTPLKAVIHGRVEKDDYTVDKVMFESLPGHYVTGSLYLPKQMRWRDVCEAWQLFRREFGGGGFPGDGWVRTFNSPW